MYTIDLQHVRLRSVINLVAYILFRTLSSFQIAISINKRVILYGY